MGGDFYLCCSQVGSSLADIYSRGKRALIMSRIRGRGNRRTELRLIQLFRAHAIFGWRRNVRMVGKPDFVFAKQRVVIFVDGCFWHGCPSHSSIPIANRRFWQEKLEQNRVRDRHVNHLLRSLGWRVLRIWQHELLRRNERPLIRRIRSVLARSRSNASS